MAFDEAMSIINFTTEHTRKTDSKIKKKKTPEICF